MKTKYCLEKQRFHSYKRHLQKTVGRKKMLVVSGHIVLSDLIFKTRAAQIFLLENIDNIANTQ